MGSYDHFFNCCVFFGKIKMFNIVTVQLYDNVTLMQCSGHYIVTDSYNVTEQSS